MNRSVAKKNAAVFLILLVGILFLLAVYPLRLFTTTAQLTGEGTIVASSDPVDADNDAGDYFTAQYSHLDILETWIEEVEKEGSVTLRLFHVKSDGSLENLAEEEQQLPQEKGFVSFPIDVDTVPGDTYIYILYANDDAVFRSGYESAAIPDRGRRGNKTHLPDPAPKDDLPLSHGRHSPCHAGSSGHCAAVLQETRKE